MRRTNSRESGTALRSNARRTRRRQAIIAAAAATLTMLQHERAAHATAIWDGSAAVGVAGDGLNWFDANNWTTNGIVDSPPEAPASIQDIIFGGSSAQQVNLNTNRLANSLTFNANFTLDNTGSTNTLTVTNGIISVAPSVTATINAALAGNAGLTTSGGGGTLVLNGPALYTGATTISGAHLVANTSSLGTGDITIASSGALAIQQNFTFNQNVNNSGDLSFAPGVNAAFASTSQTFIQTAGTLESPTGNLLVTGVFNDNGGNIVGTVRLGGPGGNPTLNFGAGAAGSGSFLISSTSAQMSGDVPTGVSVNFQPSAGSAVNATLFSNGPLTNNGTFILSAAGSNNGAILNVMNQPTLTNTGNFTVNPGPTADGQRTINANLINQSGATVNINASTTMGPIANITNNGTVNVAAGKTLSFGATGQTFTQSAGPLNVNGSLVIPAGTFQYNGGAVNGAVTLDSTSGGPTLAFAPTAGNSGSFILTGTGSGGGQLTGNIPAGVTTVYRPSNSLSAASVLTFSGSTTNSGTFILTSSNPNPIATVSFAATPTLTNLGTISSEPNPFGNGFNLGGRVINANVFNLGTATFTVNDTTTIGGSFGFSNSGTVNVAAGKALLLGSGQTFTQLDGALNLQGGLQLGGWFAYDGGQVNGTVTMGGSGANPALNFNSSAVGSGSFLLTGTNGASAAALFGNVPAGVTVTVQPINTIGTITYALNISGQAVPTTNSGTFILSSAGSSNNVAINFLGGVPTLVNAGSFIVNPGPSAEGQHIINGGFVNQSSGIVNINAATTWTNAVNYSNSGTINIAANRQLVLPGGARTFTQSGGVLNIAGSLLMNGGAFQNNGGVINGTVTLDTTGGSSFLGFGSTAGNAGSFLLIGSGNGGTSGTVPAGVSVTDQPSGSLVSSTTFSFGSSLTNNGTLLFSAVGANSGITINGFSLVNTGTLTVNPGPTADGTRALNAALTNQPNATVNINASTTINATALVSNNGTFNIGAGKTVTILTKGFSQNDGSLNIAGSLLINPFQTFTYGGGTVTGTVTLDGTGFTPTLSFGAGAGNSGSFLFTGGSATMSGNVPAGVTVNFQPNGTTAGTYSLTTAGAFKNSGTLILSSIGSNNGDQLTGFSTMTNAGTFSINPGPSGDGVRQISGGILNLFGATMNVNASTTITSSLTNSGNLNIAAGKVLSVTSGSLTAASGILSVAAGSVINMNSRALNLHGGGVITLAADAIMPASLKLFSLTFTDTNGYGLIATGAVGAGQSPGTIDLGGGTPNINVADGAFTPDLIISASITNGGLMKIGAGRLLLSGANAYAGNTTVSAGVLDFASASAIGNTASIQVLSNAGVMMDSGSLNLALLNKLAAAVMPSTGSLLLSGADAGSNIDFTTAPLSSASTAQLSIGAASPGITYTGTITPAHNLYRLGGGGTLTLPGNNALTGPRDLIITNGGAVVVSGVNDMNGVASVNAGTLTIAAGGSLATSNLVVASGATVNLNGSLSPTTTVNDSGSLSFGSNAGTGSLARTIGALNISANVTANLVASAFPAAPAVLNAGTLSFADTSAKLDLGNNELLTNATAPDIRALIVAHQIFTSSTGGVIGYADQGGGVTEVRFTLAGDANLDGSVDVADLGRLATNYNSAMPEWTAGDFDYNGTIDVGDLGALATNYGTSLASGPSAQSIATPTASTAIEPSTVPEPASAGVLALGAAACLAGRQRRRSRR